MVRYTSQSGKPYGATGYEIGDDYIIIEFQHAHSYKYSVAKCGEFHIQNMINCALNNNGLSTYVSKHRKELPHDWKH